ncbi:MAG: hypothetical protein EOO27_31840 [Comamonadaceae bacterium]|nr:MAG: hypothetical protein EOO27_31840 [Comamonadaceae bacterium]
MKTKPVLTAVDVEAILGAAKAHATTQGWAVTISVVDDGGHLLGLVRLDGAAPVSAHISPAKAHTAAIGQRDSGAYEKMINDGRVAFLSAPQLAGMLEGGVPIVVEGHVVGAVGVSGVKPNEDVETARAGIAALKA